jgi:hypothetical protein
VQQHLPVAGHGHVGFDQPKVVKGGFAARAGGEQDLAVLGRSHDPSPGTRVGLPV